MNKIGIIYLATIGLLFSSISLSNVHAEENPYELSKKVINHQLEEKKPLKDKIIYPYTFNQLQTNTHNSLKGFQTLKSLNRYYKSSNTNDEPLNEREYNDDFASANTTLHDRVMIGQLLPMYDVDMFKVNVPAKGILLVGGTTNSYAIDLLFAAFEKDFKENGNIEYLGYDYDGDIEIHAYKVNKTGTYYIGVIDDDYSYDIDDNTEDDLYAIMTSFVDNVPPSKPTVNKVDNNDKAVTGKAEANSTVIVKVGGKQIGSAKAKSNGTFSVNIKPQKAGVTLSVYSKDSTGNISTGASAKVVDVIPPAKPVVNKVDNNDNVVTGKAEPKSTVTVKRGSKVLGSVKATSKGTFSVKIAVQKAGTKLAITAKDAAGNVSSSATTNVIDVVPPKKPIINRVDSNDKVVTGKAEANSKVTVKAGSKYLGSANTNSKGSYSVNIKPQKRGTIIFVTAKDNARNISKKATTKVVRP